MLNAEKVRKQLQNMRTECGITYSFMARKANINDSTFRKFIYGERSISEENLIKLIRAFGLDNF